MLIRQRREGRAASARVRFPAEYLSSPARGLLVGRRFEPNHAILQIEHHIVTEEDGDARIYHGNLLFSAAHRNVIHAHLIPGGRAEGEATGRLIGPSFQN